MALLQAAGWALAFMVGFLLLIVALNFVFTAAEWMNKRFKYTWHVATFFFVWLVCTLLIHGV
jgi:hypothetical protein